MIAALRDGSMNGRVHQPDEISDLQKSKKWMDRHGQFIKKVPVPAALSKMRLREWWCKHKVTATDGEPPGQGETDKGRTLFMAGARQAVCALMENVKYLPEIVGDCYRKIEASAKSKHGLARCVSEKGESSLEKFHHLLAHFANMGMRRTLADSLNLRGTARYNLKLWHKLFLDKSCSQEVVPSHFQDEPCFLSHLKLKEINRRAFKHGAKFPRHKNLRHCPEDNGEEFLSEYLLSQRKRRAQYPQHPTNSRCQCPKCAANPKPLPHIQRTIEQQSTVEDSTVPVEQQSLVEDNTVPPSNTEELDGPEFVSPEFVSTVDIEPEPQKTPQRIRDFTPADWFSMHQNLNAVSTNQVMPTSILPVPETPVAPVVSASLPPPVASAGLPLFAGSRFCSFNSYCQPIPASTIMQPISPTITQPTKRRKQKREEEFCCEGRKNHVEKRLRGRVVHTFPCSKGKEGYLCL